MLDQKSGPLLKFLKKFRAGEILMREGDAPEHLFMVFDGTVDILKGDKVLARISADPNSKPLFFGTMAYFLNTKRTATVEANTECKTFAIPCASLEKVIRSSPDMALNLLAQMSTDLDRVNRQVTENQEKADKLISRLKKQSSDLVYLLELVSHDLRRWELSTLAQYAKENAYHSSAPPDMEELKLDDYLRKLVVEEKKIAFRRRNPKQQ